MGVYQPMYLFFYLLVLGLLYIPVFAGAFMRFKFTFIGIILAAISLAGYVIVALYMTGAGYYSDGGYHEDGYSSVLFNLGLMELILLAYPYIFLGLAVILGKKGERV
ncbi:hypothetical protein [Jeotgalibacillus proteolyticus]|uniref:Uncharacterized protein n=1 Tax=Jeotgalibacillus proteolyticus TaxID=2082395 RepID=A0A2S5G8P4_9BACL|nr:hypothetical protein [Jeotgalibacillus proteolyticus]PPA69372.1 hypothetical protein C4B60_16390 [Jeotgalibacillus proteolyticus]